MTTDTMPATDNAEAHNLTLLGHHDLNGFGNGGEGIDLQVTADGRRVLYIAHESAPKDFTALDVSDPRAPTLITQTDLPHNDVRSNSLSLVDNLLLVAYQTRRPGLTPAGVGVFDVSDPANPNKIAHFDTSGPHSRGAHCLWFVDGETAYVSTGAPDFQPINPLDDQIFMAVDMRNPTNPTEIGRWWLPGTRRGDEDPPPTRHPAHDAGFRIHNANVYPERPDRAYLGYLDAGVITLDIADPAHPTMISRLDYHPPFAGFTHTVLPLFDRNLLIVTDESITEDGSDHPKLTWIVDNRDETNPIIISSLPMPDANDFLNRPGRYGAHNVHENQPRPHSWHSDTIIIGAYFNAGVRVHDISNPFQPKEIAYYVPPAPEGANGINMNDVYVDENGLIYAIDRVKGGLYILELTA